MGLSTVRVAFLTPKQEILLVGRLEPGDTLEQAVRRSGLPQRCPEMDLRTFRVGVFGQLREWDSAAQAGDRIEIYRPLLANPKAARRQRAAKKARSVKR